MLLLCIKLMLAAAVQSLSHICMQPYALSALMQSGAGGSELQGTYVPKGCTPEGQQQQSTSVRQVLHFYLGARDGVGPYGVQSPFGSTWAAALVFRGIRGRISH